jgi:hypothetical protein
MPLRLPDFCPVGFFGEGGGVKSLMYAKKQQRWKDLSAIFKTRSIVMMIIGNIFTTDIPFEFTALQSGTQLSSNQRFIGFY